MVRRKPAAVTTDSELAHMLHVMAHPARLRLLNALRNGQECVCHLTALLNRRQAYVSQQLMFLRQGGLIQDRKESYRVYYHIKDARVLPLLDALNGLRGEAANTSEQQAMADCPCPRCKAEARGGGLDDGHQDSRSRLRKLPAARTPRHANARGNGSARGDS